MYLLQGRTGLQPKKNFCWQNQEKILQECVQISLAVQGGVRFSQRQDFSSLGVMTAFMSTT